MKISILTLEEDKIHNDLNFKDRKINWYFLNCSEKVPDNKEFSHGNSKPCLESGIMTF